MAEDSEDFQVIDTGYDFEKQILLDKIARKKKRIFFALFVFVVTVTIISISAINSNSLFHNHGDPGSDSSSSSTTTQSSITTGSSTTQTTSTPTTSGDTPTGDIYVQDETFTLTGIPSSYDIQFCKSVGAFRGKLYVGQDNGYPPVIVFTEDGVWEGGWGTDDLTSAHAVKVHDDMVWVVDTDNHTVKAFTLDGVLTTTIGVEGESGSSTDPLKFDRPTDVEFGPDGRVYVADGEGVNDRIVVLSAELNYEFHFGTTGHAAEQFDVPHSMAYQEEGNRLWVTDEHNNRVQVFNLDYFAFVGQWQDGDDNCNIYEPKGITTDGGYVLISTTDSHTDPATLNVYPMPEVPDSNLFAWNDCDEVEETNVASHYYHNLATGDNGVYAVDPYDGVCLHRYVLS